MGMKFITKVRDTLDWGIRIQFFVSLLLALGFGKIVKQLLLLTGKFPPDLVSAIWLISSGLLLLVLTKTAIWLKSYKTYQRKLTDEQRTSIVDSIKAQMRYDPPHPACRSVKITAIPFEDCRTYASDIASTLAMAGLSISTNLFGMDSIGENYLYHKGIWVRGHESSDLNFQPSTQAMLSEALRKANIWAVPIPSENMVELIIGTKEES